MEYLKPPKYVDEDVCLRVLGLFFVAFFVFHAGFSDLMDLCISLAFSLDFCSVLRNFGISAEYEGKMESMEEVWIQEAMRQARVSFRKP